MNDQPGRKRWKPHRDQAIEARSLEDVRSAMLECLVHAKSSTPEEEERYLEDVLRRARGDKPWTWGVLYEALTLLRDDALAAGVDPELVREHVTALHQILEEVED